MSEQPSVERQGIPESLRTAIERTLAATADSAASTRARAEALVDEVSSSASTDLRERAQELLDEVARIGQQTSDTVARRGRRAREAVSRRVEEIRPAGEGEVARMAERLASLERRIAALELRSEAEE